MIAEVMTGIALVKQSVDFIKSQIDNFLSLNGVNITLTVTGTIIPNFTDQNGTLRYIQTLINNQTPTTGIFCAVNEEALDDLIDNYKSESPKAHYLRGLILYEQGEKEKACNDLAYAYSKGLMQGTRLYDLMCLQN